MLSTDKVDARASSPGRDSPGEASALTGRERLLYAIAALVSLIGLADSIYLTIKHLNGESARCMVSTGCSKVLGSTYASIGGIPLAVLGAMAYFTFFSLATLAAFDYALARRLLVFVVALMLAVTLLLLYLQAFVIGEYCDFCLLSAATTITLAALVFAARFIFKRS